MTWNEMVCHTNVHVIVKPKRKTQMLRIDYKENTFVLEKLFDYQTYKMLNMFDNICVFYSLFDKDVLIGILLLLCKLFHTIRKLNIAFFLFECPAL